MTVTEPAVFTNMCMIYDGDKILVQDRVDPDWPGVTFPGGHVEPGESFVRSVIREMKEETGLDIREPKLCGIKQWVDNKENYRYIVLFYKTDKFSGTLRSSDEGVMRWIRLDELKKYHLAESFDEMIKVFLDDSLSESYNYYAEDKWICENL
ncbi:MAG: 8-oxo-dGTP diphosphatase [Clostridia bacterium]|nr:8-oxo-dGTP diphosphatase [Clostridia bacterium]